MAGLWEAWLGPGKSDGPPLESCSLITTDANKVRIAGRFPYELLEALRPKKAADAAVPAIKQ